MASLATPSVTVSKLQSHHMGEIFSMNVLKGKASNVFTIFSANSMWYCNEGDTKLTICTPKDITEEVALKRGDCFYLPKGTFFKLENTGLKNASFLIAADDERAIIKKVAARAFSKPEGFTQLFKSIGDNRADKIAECGAKLAFGLATDSLEMDRIYYDKGYKPTFRSQAQTLQECFFVTEGEGNMTIDGKIHEMKPGTLLHVPPKSWHSVENTGETALKVVIVVMPRFPEANPEAEISKEKI